LGLTALSAVSVIQKNAGSFYLTGVHAAFGQRGGIFPCPVVQDAFGVILLVPTATTVFVPATGAVTATFAPLPPPPEGGGG